MGNPVLARWHVYIYTETPPGHCEIYVFVGSGLILGLRPANERRDYFVTTSLIGWAQAENQPRGLHYVAPVVIGMFGTGVYKSARIMWNHIVQDKIWMN